MAWNIDLHCHSFFSGDGVSSPEDMIASARRKGLHGFALTDHNTCDGVHYLLDKGLMRADGQPVDDFIIIPAVEMTTAEGHLLCLGVDLPDLKGTPAAEVCAQVHQQGGLAIPPHPYDLFRAGIRQGTLDALEIDALEVFNAATTLKRYNTQAYRYAQVRGLPMTAGQRCSPRGGNRHCIHDPRYPGFHPPGSAGPDREDQSAQSEVHEPEGHLPQNVEQLASAAETPPACF